MSKNEKARTRCHLYSPEPPHSGRLFDSAEAIDAAIEEGWAESPAEAAAALKASGTKSSGKSSGGGKKGATDDDSK